MLAGAADPYLPQYGITSGRGSGLRAAHVGVPQNVKSTFLMPNRSERESKSSIAPHLNLPGPTWSWFQRGAQLSRKAPALTRGSVV